MLISGNGSTLVRRQPPVLAPHPEAPMRSLPSFLLLFASLAAPLAAQDHQVIKAPGAAVGLPFSSAVRGGTMLYLSGQLGNTPGTRQLADTGIVGQTQQVFENVKLLRPAAARSSEW
jgi:enamine deaminase RidA (YjgF/YER057c/UK114 family)